MTVGRETDQSLNAIYAETIKLAADRLKYMSAGQENIEFDRDARSVGVLVRTATQVNALKADIEKAMNVDEADDQPRTPTEDELAGFKAEILARLQRVDERASDAQGGTCCVEDDISDGGRV